MSPAVLGTDAARPYEPLRALSLGDVRARFSPRCYERSTAVALAWLAFDLALYGTAQAGVFLAGDVRLQLACALVAGVAVSSLFVWSHDAAHGALFASSAWSEILGTIAMLPSLQVYRLWQHGHNRVHHGFTSLSPVDWIWRPLTPAEYRARPLLGRAVYRLERHPATCGLHYLLRVWWAGMVRFRPEPGRRRRGFIAGKAASLGFALLASGLAYRWAGGWAGVVSAVVVPFAVFTWVMAFVVYLHHTHPAVPFFVDRREWSATIGQVACSTVVRAGRLVNLLTHNILVHVPHHVDTRIPFYRLPRAWADLPPEVRRHVQEYRLTWSAARRTFRACQLYDFEARTWYRFAELDDLPGLSGN